MILHISPYFCVSNFPLHKIASYTGYQKYLTSLNFAYMIVVLDKCQVTIEKYFFTYVMEDVRFHQAFPLKDVIDCNNFLLDRRLRKLKTDSE